MGYLTVTKLTDPVVSSIPAAEAREVAYSKVRCVNRFEFAVLPKHEDILRDLFGANWEKKRNLAVSAENPFRAPEEFADPNAAMIARDVAVWSALPGVTVGYAEEAYVVSDIQTSAWIHWEVVESSAKPAIAGLTTLHDGKERGLGWCSDV